MKFIKKGIIKVIPDRILLNLDKKIKPRIVCKYIDSNNEVRGYGLGIFLNNKNNDCKENTERIINSIASLNLMDIDRIVVYKSSLIDREGIGVICQKYNIKMYDGREIKYKTLIYALKKLLKEKYDLFKDKEILIISDSTEISKRVVFELAKEFNYITVLGDSKDFNRELANNVLYETGLSIYTTTKLNANLGKYGIIVNLSDNLRLNVLDFNKSSIIVDFSTQRTIFEQIKKIKGRILVITDFIFKRDQNIRSFPPGYELNKEIPSYFYQSIQNFDLKDLKKIEINDKVYRFKEARKILFQNVKI